jgi:1,4-alpha-glucan branching enzyme
VIKERRRKMPRRSSKKTSTKNKKVLFFISAPGAESVSLAGNFNDWNPNSLPMKRDEKGNWKVTVDLASGRYEYRFLVDGVWYDERNPQERVDNPFGTQNSVRTVN